MGSSSRAVPVTGSYVCPICECGHPEMRLLPNGVYRFRACGAEVLPVGGSRSYLGRDEGGGTA